MSNDISPLAAKRRLLLQKLMQEQTRPGTKCAIDVVPRDGSPLPTSSVQQGIWFLEQLSPIPSLHNVPLLLRLAGNLDREALTNAVNAIISRHEILRSTFADPNGVLVQTAIADCTLTPHFVQLREADRESRERQARQLAAEEADRPFDLTLGPLLRLTVFEMGPREHWLLLNVHHIAFDGWSGGVFFADLMVAYTACRDGHPATLPSLHIQYGDYAAWQQQRLNGPEMQRQIDYWVEHLRGASPTLSLPTDRPRPPQQSFKGADHSFTLANELVDGLLALSQREGVTLFMTVFTAYAILLHHYSQQQDILVGVPVANRLPDTEPLIGCFINTVVVRADLSEDMPFRALLARIRKGCLGAYANQEVPLEKLVEILQPERDSSRLPLFQAMFQLQMIANSRQVANLPGLTIEGIDLPRTSVPCDLFLDLLHTSRGLKGTFQYCDALFNRETILRMEGHFQTLLQSMVNNPDHGWSELEYLTHAEKQQLVVTWNDTRVDYARDASLPQLYEAQVERTPDAIAVMYEREMLTYQELNVRANQLARALQKLEVGPDSLVGLCLERSIEMVVGVLGILKTGAAYVPLDPHHPAQRRQLVLTEAGVRVLLTESTLLGANLHATEVPVVCLDRERARIDTEAEDNLDIVIRATDLAYVMYTSGSTGRPKGVCIQHRSVNNILTDMRRKLNFSATDRLVSITTLAFDISVLELFLPITTGACLVIAPQAVVADGVLLIQLLRTAKATMLQATPATWRMLSWCGVLPAGLKALCGGEALPEELAHRLLDQACQLWNVYGPTETTIWSTIKRMERGRVTIGRPLANTRVYVLDKKRRLVPVGVAGELYLGGDGLAQGYFNRPELTAERFVRDPFSEGELKPERAEADEARIYQTGDLVRWLPDGDLEYLGRLDHQVKIRGFRIELGEVESALVTLPEVREAVAMVYGNTPDNRRLVAYCVLAEAAHEPGAATERMRTMLTARLPDYMVPAQIIVLDQLPLSPNGKVNRKALPEPDIVSATAGGEEPASAIEERLVALWERVLGRSSIGVTDSFFALGGHSLLAILLLASVEQEFGVRLTLASVLRTPTVREMARLLQNEQQGNLNWTSVVPLQSSGSLPALFCAPPGGGSVFYYRYLAKHIGDIQPLYTFEPRGMSGNIPPHETVEETATYYIQEMRTVQQCGPYLLCGLSFGGLVAYEMARQLEAAGEAVALLILFDTWGTGYTQALNFSDGAWPMRISRSIRYKIGFHCENLSACQDTGARIAYLWKRFRSVKRQLGQDRRVVKGNSGHANPAEVALPEIFEAEKRAEIRATEVYDPGAYGGTVHLFRARLQRGASSEASLGWSRLVRDLKIVEVLGTHYSLLDEPCVQVNVQHLHHLLAEVRPL